MRSRRAASAVSDVDCSGGREDVDESEEDDGDDGMGEVVVIAGGEVTGTTVEGSSSSLSIS